MLIYCPECGNGCSPEASACPKCGHPLAPPFDLNALQASVETPPLTQQEIWAEETTRMRTPVKERSGAPGTAAVLSVLWPGLGQIYRGEINGGFTWMICVFVGYFLLIVPGLVLHYMCVTDAHGPHRTRF